MQTKSVLTTLSLALLFSSSAFGMQILSRHSKKIVFLGGASLAASYGYKTSIDRKIKKLEELKMDNQSSYTTVTSLEKLNTWKHNATTEAKSKLENARADNTVSPEQLKELEMQTSKKLERIDSTYVNAFVTGRLED